MKKVLIFTFVSLSFTNCLKKNDNNVSKNTCYLTQITTDNKKVQKNYYYSYTGSNLIAKVTCKDKTNNIVSYDTVYYKGSNVLDSVVRFKRDSLQKFVVDVSYGYDFENGFIRKIVKKGTYNYAPYTKTYTFSYTGNSIESIVSSGDPAGMNESYTNVVFSSGVVYSFTYDPTGSGPKINMTTYQSDEFQNVNSYTLPFPENIIEYISNYNIMQITTDAQVVYKSTTLSAGTFFINHYYSYNGGNGQVDYKYDYPTFFNGITDTTVLLYNFNCH